MNHMNPFHLAFPVKDLEQTRSFYKDALGCTFGRESELWIDFDFFGHQISAHLTPEEWVAANANEVDGEQVPVRHFGIVMKWDQWEQTAKILEDKQVGFLIEPTVRFKGKVGEQGTFFVKDPSGNVLEFKTFKDMDNLFKK